MNEDVLNASEEEKTLEEVVAEVAGAVLVVGGLALLGYGIASLIKINKEWTEEHEAFVRVRKSLESTRDSLILKMALEEAEKIKKEGAE